MNEDLKQSHILIVDDTLTTVELLEAILRSAGYDQIESTTDPALALRLYEQFRPDLILLDLMMPRLDGFAVMDQIQPQIAAESYLPILVLTGDGRPESKERALRAGAMDFLTKPFDGAEVTLRVRNLLQTRRLHCNLQLQNQRLEEQKEHLQILSQRLIEVQESERRRIARELHDEIGSALTAAKLNVQSAQRLLMVNAAELGPHLEEGLAVIDRTLQQVRQLSLDLRPSMLDDFGLLEALSWYVERQGQWAGLEAAFRHHGCADRLPPTLETTCFRVVQEALTNIIRHARARRVLVELQVDERQVDLAIKDDGAGFDVAAMKQRAERGDSFGLIGMEERVLLAGGTLSLQSTPAQGTQVHVHFPAPAR